MRIGAVARKSGCSVESLRFYEARGLIAPVDRTPAGYRLYSPAVLARLEFVRKAQSAGFSLDDVARIVAIADSGKKPCQQVRALAREKLVELEAKLVELAAMRDRLNQVIATWDDIGEANGEVCGLIESLANGVED